MYLKSFHKAPHTRRFSIRDTGKCGWEVVEEKDSEIVKSVRYDDWHRVERARAAFALEARNLRDAGWTES
jgi:hypothetical protein